jgi:hypothetical protein
MKGRLGLYFWNNDEPAATDRGSLGERHAWARTDKLRSGPFLSSTQTMGRTPLLIRVKGARGRVKKNTARSNTYRPAVDVGCKRGFLNWLWVVLMISSERGSSQEVSPWS